MSITAAPAFRDFLAYVGEAGYANEQPPTKHLPDGSHDIVLERDGWKYHDNWFGGEPFGGMEVISKGEKPFWMMVYFGAIIDPSEEPADVYTALKEALRQPDAAMPVRGQRKLAASNGYSYAFIWTGDLDRFQGQENICNPQGALIYKSEVSGGLINQ
ncbi:hypothetical protein IT415_01835 [bacterium]|nr:hypothetical protein [bacterium]